MQCYGRPLQYHPSKAGSQRVVTSRQKNSDFIFTHLGCTRGKTLSQATINYTQSLVRNIVVYLKLLLVTCIYDMPSGVPPDIRIALFAGGAQRTMTSIDDQLPRRNNINALNIVNKIEIPIFMQKCMMLQVKTLKNKRYFLVLLKTLLKLSKNLNLQIAKCILIK